MKSILGTTWGASILSAIFGAALVALIGIITGAPSVVTIFAAVVFGAFLTLIIQLSVIITILWQARRAKNDIGATMIQETESPTGQAELKKMDFASLLTVAVVQELHVSLFKRDEPLWIWLFLGLGEDKVTPRDYGALNRYLEWALVIGLIVFTLVSAILLALFANSINALLCALPAFIVGMILMFFVGLFFASVIRRLAILYSMRTDEDSIK
jgi:hypothetical protein